MPCDVLSIYVCYDRIESSDVQCPAPFKGVRPLRYSVLNFPESRVRKYAFATACSSCTVKSVVYQQ